MPAVNKCPKCGADWQRLLSEFVSSDDASREAACTCGLEFRLDRDGHRIVFTAPPGEGARLHVRLAQGPRKA